MPIESDRVGDTFQAHVTRDVVVEGEVVIAAGSPAEVRLVEESTPRPERGHVAVWRRCT